MAAVSFLDYFSAPPTLAWTTLLSLRGCFSLIRSEPYLEGGSARGARDAKSVRSYCLYCLLLYAFTNSHNNCRDLTPSMACLKSESCFWVQGLVL